MATWKGPQEMVSGSTFTWQMRGRGEWRGINDDLWGKLNRKRKTFLGPRTAAACGGENIWDKNFSSNIVVAHPISYRPRFHFNSDDKSCDQMNSLKALRRKEMFCELFISKDLLRCGFMPNVKWQTNQKESITTQFSDDPRQWRSQGSWLAESIRVSYAIEPFPHVILWVDGIFTYLWPLLALTSAFRQTKCKRLTSSGFRPAIGIIYEQSNRLD